MPSPKQTPSALFSTQSPSADLRATNTASKSPTEQAPTLTPILAPQDPTLSLVEAYRTRIRRNFRLEGEIVIGDNKSRYICDIQPPDSFQYYDVDHKRISFVVVAENKYLHTEEGWVINNAMPNPLQAYDAEVFETTLFGDVKYSGVEDLDGMPMWVFDYMLSYENEGREFVHQIKTWVGIIDGLIYKNIIVGEATSFDEAGQISYVPSTTTELFVYNVTIDINIPTPISTLGEPLTTGTP